MRVGINNDDDDDDDEMKFITEGEFNISDETGQTVSAKPGHVLYFPRGILATYTPESYGMGFHVQSFLFCRPDQC